jgi:hypothetical protein
MAVFGRYYHLQFKQSDRNFDNVFVENDVHIRIYDLSLEGDDTIAWKVVELDGSGDPFRTSTIDNGEDKFTGIKPTQAIIKFISTDSVNVATFADSPIDTAAGGVDPGDPRWYVDAYLNTPASGNFIFKGFLNLDDCSEAFMPLKNEVVLVANDGLGGLKNIPLVKPDGTNPTGWNRIADYLAWALQKTGLELNLNAVFNIREKYLGTSHFFDAIYLHAKTFEDQIGTCVSCFDVIERILGEEAFLTQRGGQWWIVRVDELGNGNGFYRAIFNSDGVLQSIENAVFFVKLIEKDTTGIFFSQEATTVNLLRPHKSIQETYNFDYPQEIIDNIDFSRMGSLYLTLDMSNETVDGVSYYVRKYHLIDWVLENAGGGANQITSYFKKLFQDSNLTYEKERYLVLTDGQTIQHWDKSNPIEIHKNDKIEISLDRRLPVRWGGSIDIAETFAQVRLYGDDGTFWTFGQAIDSPDAEGRWKLTNSTFTAPPVSYIDAFYNTADIQNNQWQSVSAKSAPAPVSGKVYILLLAAHLESPYRTRETHFSNIRFTYIPYINGSYSKYTSYYYKIFRNENILNKREKQVYISDGFKKLFKGGLHKQDGLGFAIANLFYAWNDIHTSSPGDEFCHPYAHIQAFDVWNQYRNTLRKFQATLQGLGYGSTDQSGSFLAYPSLIHRYYLQDTNDNTNDRYFMLLSFDIDWKTCEWTGTLIECYNTAIGKHYDDNLETKYIQ